VPRCLRVTCGFCASPVAKARVTTPEETDTAQAPLITEFPMAQQIRLRGRGACDLGNSTGTFLKSRTSSAASARYRAK